MTSVASQGVGMAAVRNLDKKLSVHLLPHMTVKSIPQVPTGRFRRLVQRGYVPVATRRDDVALW